MFRSVFGSRAKAHGLDQPSELAEAPQNLESAMQGVLHIMNDDVVTAEAELKKGSSAFHTAGIGLSLFLRAVLGMEQEVMREAADKLNATETQAGGMQQKAQRHPREGSIYPPGTEYALTIAMAQLMGAVLAVLNESLAEGIRGFYKLRKSYITLNGILEVERKYVAQLGKTASSTPATSTEPQTPASSSVPQSSTSINKDLSSDLKQSSVTKGEVEDDEFVDVAEDLDGKATPNTYQGHLEKETASENDISPIPNGTDTKPLSNLASEQEPQNSKVSSTKPDLLRAPTGLAQGPDASLFSGDPIDDFIHAGSNLCFGTLLLMLSIIPPVFAMLLKIVGFRGDRERGLALLWQATKSPGIHGAFAGLVLCGYYNAVVGFCDITPPDAYPKERCHALLHEMRTRFPKSRLWLLEEARALASEKKPDEAVRIISEQEKSPLKQVEALQWFERSLDCMYIHEYADSSESFQKCVHLNNWSHALYYYIAGAATVELYREAKLSGDEQTAKERGEEATTLLRKVPEHTGKKRFMARQLPLDVFVSRKLVKWEERAKTWNCSFIEAIGVSPLEEMIFFWNGYKRMRPEHLEKSLSSLSWSESEANSVFWAKEGLDEHAILALLRSNCLRNLQRRDEARQMLQKEIILHEWAEFKGGHKDNWTCPVAHYEMAINCFQDCDGTDKDQERLADCARWLEKVAAWESYDLEARMGMRVTTAKETLRKKGVTVA